MPQLLGEAARLVRSKNAGPFWLTFDVFLPTPELFAAASHSALTDPQWFADIYGVSSADVEIHLVASILAIKVSIPRPCVQGSLGDNDQHGGQQYVPLLGIEVP